MKIKSKSGECRGSFKPPWASMQTFGEKAGMTKTKRDDQNSSQDVGKKNSLKPLVQENISFHSYYKVS